jgi:hypothetical protein
MNTTTEFPKAWNGRLGFYHPTAANTGTAARLEFHAARPERDGCFFLEMARQKTAPARTAGNRTAATFDWENKITVKLGLTDICSLLLVLEGRCDQAGGARGGIFHDSSGCNTVINLRRQAEPAVGFALEVSRKAKHEGAEVRRARVVMTDGEGVALRCIFQHAIFPLVFGDGAAETAPSQRRAREEAVAETAAAG